MEKIHFEVRFKHKFDDSFKTYGEKFVDEESAKKKAMEILTGSDDTFTPCVAELVKVTTIEEPLYMYNRIVSIVEDKFR